MRKACGQPLILWLMLVETKSLKSLFVHGTGLGQSKTTVPGVAEAEVAVTWHIAWLSWGRGGLPGRHGLHSCTDWWAQCPALSLRCL